MNNLSNIKVGDKVFQNRAWTSLKRVLTVTKVTKQHICIGEEKYRMDGSAVHGRYGIFPIKEGELEANTKAIADHKRKQEIIIALGEKNFKYTGQLEWLSIEKFEALHKAICE